MASTHHMHLAMNASMLPFEPCGLATVQLALPETVADASLLVELTLGQDGFLGSVCRRLCESDGRRRKERRHKCELRESHGVFLLLLAAVLCPHTQEETQGSGIGFQPKGVDVWEVRCREEAGFQ